MVTINAIDNIVNRLTKTLSKFSEKTYKGQIIKFKWKGKILKGKVYEPGDGFANVFVGPRRYFIKKQINRQWIGVNEL